MGLDERKQTREIDGVTYEVTPLGFGVGRAALMRLLKIVGPVLSAALRESGSKLSAAAVLEVLPTALSDEDIVYFARTFGQSSKFLGKDSNWVPLVEKVQDDHFAGRYLPFLRWLIFSTEVNFSGFFDGLKGEISGTTLLSVVMPNASTSMAGTG